MSNNDNKYDVPISGHDYDGIQELDNSLPRWWVWMFYLTIAFGGAYFGYYEMGPGKTLVQTYHQDRAALDAEKAKNGPGDSVDTNAILAAYKDQGQLAKGKAVFLARCASCHMPTGAGLIGPNLTDDYWIHGGKLEQIAMTISKGAADKGMPPWGPILSAEELIQVTAFVKSLKGTNPPNAKAPQGEIYKE